MNAVKKKHELIDIILLVISALLSGSEGWDIEWFEHQKLDCWTSNQEKADYILSFKYVPMHFAQEKCYIDCMGEFIALFVGL